MAKKNAFLTGFLALLVSFTVLAGCAGEGIEDNDSGNAIVPAQYQGNWQMPAISSLNGMLTITDTTFIHPYIGTCKVESIATSGEWHEIGFGNPIGNYILSLNASGQLVLAYSGVNNSSFIPGTYWKW